MLYIVVPTYNRIQIFNAFVRQLKEQTNQEYKLIVVDHGNEKTHFTDNDVVMIESEVNGWSYAINIGIRYVLNLAEVTEKDYIMVINDDVLMESDYIENVWKSIRERPNSVIGSGCFDWDTGKILHVNMILNKPKAIFYYRNLDKTRNELTAPFYKSDVLKGRGTVFPVWILRKIGIYDEKKLPHYRADHELAWRARKSGYDVCVGGRMWLGAKLDSPHTLDGRLSIKENYRRIFKDMISTQNTKDLWNYSKCCFGGIYGLYFYLLNFVRFHLFFVLEYSRERRIYRKGNI